jgi:hypothetical protein
MSWNPGRTPGPAADRRRTAPPRLSRSQLEPPPLALGTLSDQEPCRWELRSKFPADQADRAIQLTVGTAALALAAWVAGTVIDPYGFPVSQPQNLLPADAMPRCSAQPYPTRPASWKLAPAKTR